MDERDKEEKQGVTISDKRHTRDFSEEPEEETVQPVEDVPVAKAPEALQVEPTEEQPVTPEPTGVVEFPSQEKRSDPVVAQEPADQDPAPVAEQHAGQEPQTEPLADDSPEAQHVRLLFETGIVGYLHGQLDLLFTFALIYLGRRPNPATGLVAADLPKARLAIDTLAFIFDNTQQELPEQDRAGFLNLLNGLKMEYAQAGQGNSTTPSSDEGQA